MDCETLIPESKLLQKTEATGKLHQPQIGELSLQATSRSPAFSVQIY